MRTYIECVNDPSSYRMDDLRTGVVGPPIPGVEIKLRSCLDAKGEPEILDRHGKPYLSKDSRAANGKRVLGMVNALLQCDIYVLY